jgi:PIN domain nuclease of toxin-antitoxin system
VHSQSYSHQAFVSRCPKAFFLIIHSRSSNPKLAESCVELETDTLEWVNTALEVSGIQLCPITPRIAIQSSRLPGNVHGDPVDRLLIATAFDEKLVLITCDQKILEYSSENLINTFDPS